MQEDLTLNEVLKDTLIRQMMIADGVSLTEFASVLRKAAYEYMSRHGDAPLALVHAEQHAPQIAERHNALRR